MHNDFFDWTPLNKINILSISSGLDYKHFKQWNLTDKNQLIIVADFSVKSYWLIVYLVKHKRSKVRVFLIKYSLIFGEILSPF